MHCCGRQVLFATAGVLCSSAGSRGNHALIFRSLARGRSSLSEAATTPAEAEFFVTLERASDIHNSEDEALWQSGVFDAEVHPELPPSSTLGGILRYYLRRAREAVIESNHHHGSSSSSSSIRGTRGRGNPTESSPTATRAGCVFQRPATDSYVQCTAVDEEREKDYLVRTVPVQISRTRELRRRLAAAAGVDSEGIAVGGCRPADALLLVSGSHPVRRLPFARWFLPDVYDELRLATSMRNSGHLPKELVLWAVANPLTEAHEAGIERLRKKVDLGAEVILTQPPLVWELFERWLRAVHASGALTGGSAPRGEAEERAGRKMTTTTTTKVNSHQRAGDRRYPSPLTRAGGRGRGATLLVGLPVITSPKGLHFWLDLCDVGNNRSVCRGASEAFENFTSVRGTEHSLQPPLEERQDGDTTSADTSPRTGRDESSSSIFTSDSALASSPPYGQEWLEATLSQLKSLHGLGVAGVHVMALGRGPSRQARELARRGVFGSRRR